jgi:hypothetical protein
LKTGIPVRLDRAVAISNIKLRPRFLIALFEPGIGTRIGLRICCVGILFIKLQRAEVIISSARLTPDSFALSNIDFAIGEYLIDEYTVKFFMVC